MRKFMLLLLGICMLSGCAQQQNTDEMILLEEAETEDNGYIQIPVLRGTLKSEVSLACRYSPKAKITCAFEGPEREIEEILVEKGDFVSKGQVLACQDVEEYEERILEEQHAVEMAELTAKQLAEMKKLDLDYMERSYEFQDEETRDGGEYKLNCEKTSQQYDEEITDCKDEITVHTLRVEEYRKKIEEGIIRAPEDGIITISHTDLEGKLSKPTENVITMIGNDSLVFVSDETEKKQYLQKERTYQVLVGKGESQKSIEVIWAGENEEEKELYFEIKTPDLKLESGSLGTIWITLEEKGNVLYLPNDVICESGEKRYVYTLSEEGVREICYITTGISDREYTEVVDGLQEGEYVLQKQAFLYVEGSSQNQLSGESKIKEKKYYDGEVTPYTEILQFSRKGTFSEYRVALGDAVKRGQVLAVTQPEFEEEIEELEKELSQLKTEYANAITNFDLRMKTNRWRAGQMREMIENMDPAFAGFDDICISFELILMDGEKQKIEKQHYIDKTEKEITYREQKLARLKQKNTDNTIVAPEDGVITYQADLKTGDAVGVNSYPIAVSDVSGCLIQCEYVTKTEINEMDRIYALKDGKEYDLVYYPYKDGEFERKSAKGEGVFTYFSLETPSEDVSFGEDVKVIMVKKKGER